MKNIIKKLIYNIFCLLPINNKIITFESFSGRKYADNPRAIYEEIKRQQLNYICKWFMNKKSDVSSIDKNDVVYKGTIKWLYYTAVSKVWIKNTGAYGGFKKRKKQIYIQTWHGIPIKKMGFDVNPLQTDNSVCKNWDYVISPNNYYERCLNSSYHLELNYLKIGYPRNDKFYNYTKEYAVNIKKRLGIDDDKKIILYAPTFRDAEINNNDKNADIFKVFKEFPDKYLILFKAHYFLNKIIDNTKNVIDVSDYSDISELMIISDILITDYSSVLFDYLNLKKPMIFFACDLEYYRDIERGFYLDYNELPGPIVKTDEELLKAVDNIDNYWVQFGNKYNKFIKEYCQYEDGQASKRVVEFINNIIGKRELKK